MNKLMKNMTLALMGLLFMATGAMAQTTFSATFVVPYRIVCEKQNDGQELIKVQILLRKTDIAITLVSEFEPTRPHSVMLQPKTGTDLDALAAEFTATGKVFGLKAQSFFELIEGFESITTYLVKAPVGKGDDKDFARTKLNAGADEELEWVDLDFNGNDLDLCIGKTKATHYALCGVLLEDRLAQFAEVNFHGTACCCPDFGVNSSDRACIILKILQGLMNPGCGDFTAMGTLDSCGDTGKVKVVGERKSPKTVNICGKCFKIVDLGVVEGTQSATQCVIQFINDRLNTYFTGDFRSKDPVAPCGFEAFLETLLTNGYHYDTRGEGNDFQRVFEKLVLFCVDSEKNIYDLGFLVNTQSVDGNTVSDVTNHLDKAGCRFQLVPCKNKC